MTHPWFATLRWPFVGVLAFAACGGSKDTEDAGNCPPPPASISSPCGSISVSPSVVAPGGQITATADYTGPCMTTVGGVGNLPSVQLSEATTIVIAGESVDGTAQPSSGFPRVGGSAATFDGTSGSHSVTFTIAAGNANPNTVCPKESCTTNIAATQCIVPAVVLTTNQGNALAPFALGAVLKRVREKVDQFDRLGATVTEKSR